MRISVRPLVLLFIAVCAIGGAVSFIMIRAEKENYIAPKLDNLQAVVDLKYQRVIDFSNERLLDLRVASNFQFPPGWQESFLAGSPTQRRFLVFLRPLLDSGNYSSIAVFDRRGRLLLAAPQGAETPVPSPGPAGAARFLGARRAGNGTAVMDYEAALPDGGRLVFRVPHSAWFKQGVQFWTGAEKTGEILLFKLEKGSLVAINQFRFKADTAFSYAIRLDSDLISARAARGEATPILGKDYRGTRCYAAARIMKEFGWLIVVKADEAEFLAPWRQKLWTYSVAGGGFVSLLTGIFLVCLRLHSDRLQQEGQDERRLLATAIEQAGESIVITDKAARIRYVNPAFARATGYTRAEALGKTPALIKSGRHDASFYAALWGTITQGRTWSGRLINKRKNGTLYEEDATITPVRDTEGKISHYIAVKRDISAVKSLEQKLEHSQKMEAIGRLAGGVAHDFNNILTTINGYSEMLADAAVPDSQIALDLAEILGAGRRAALLTRQLLTFSRRAPADPVALDLRASARSLEKMLRRTLDENIALTICGDGDSAWVRADSGQIDQIIMNLAVNARDAMPNGGPLTIETGTRTLSENEPCHSEAIPPGRYSVLAVTDAGTGMSDDVLTRLFEPFFTTKQKGKGTGLGLATVFGIVKQNHGFIRVDSVVGRGTTFTVLLPLIEAPNGPAAAPSGAPAEMMRGDETILVAEDQSEVLRLVTRALTHQGYRVISCVGGPEALEAAKRHPGRIHMLLTDVVMPAMSGPELAALLRHERADTRVLFMSGYTDGRLDAVIGEGAKYSLLLKPFTAVELCRRVREEIDGAGKAS